MLFEEEAFADLIAADEGLRRAELLEQLQDLAILKHTGVDGESRCVNQFDASGCPRFDSDETARARGYGKARAPRRRDAGFGTGGP